jgi:hypothetical protein
MVVQVVERVGILLLELLEPLSLAVKVMLEDRVFQTMFFIPQAVVVVVQALLELLEVALLLPQVERVLQAVLQALR